MKRVLLKENDTSLFLWKTGVWYLNDRKIKIVMAKYIFNVRRNLRRHTCKVNNNLFLKCEYFTF